MPLLPRGRGRPLACPRVQADGLQEGPGCARSLAAEDKSGGVEEIVGFAQGIRQDLAAVETALSTQWSAGQTEGNINRLKLIKRSMYGRAGFDLLRAKVLHHDTVAWQDTRVVFGMPPPSTLIVQ